MKQVVNELAGLALGNKDAIDRKPVALWADVGQNDLLERLDLPATARQAGAR